MRSHRLSLCLALLSLALCIDASSAAVSKRVLIIGVDGAGGSYTQTANMPNLDALAAAGGARYDWLNEGALYENPPEGYGASGVNWSTITTGASAAHHGVIDNSFGGSHFDQYPFFFEYLKQKDPSLYTASIVDWAPINDVILDKSTADLSVQGVDDATVASTAVNLLTNGDPDAIFLHFDQVDHAGHSIGWGTGTYYTALQTVDGLIGNVMGALNARPGVVNGTESWLVMVTADHGGQGLSHYASQGTINWHVPFVISGPAIPDGAVLPQGTLRDVVPTALWHMGVDPFSTPVDGKVVGLTFGAPNGIVGDVNQDGIIAGNGKGPAASDDVTAFVQGWLTRNHPSVLESYRSGDLNLDRVTDLKDWIILNRLNPAMASAALASIRGVPEPASCGLAAFAVAALAAWRRKLRRASRLSGAAVLAATAATPIAASAALTDNLVALYEFDGNFLDSSGSPFLSNGTPVNGPQFTAGKIGQAMWLPGVKDYMSLNPATLTELNFGTTTDFSVSMWVRQDDFVSDPAVFSNKNWATGDNVGINWAVKGNGVFDLNTRASGGNRLDLDTAQNSAPLGVGVWSHVLMTIDRDGPTKLYINGVNTGTINLSSQGTFQSGLPWNVGQDGTGNYGPEFTGAVDELAIWRRALSPGEASQLWNTGAGIDLGAQVVDSRLRLVIDRNSGQMTIKNNMGATQPIIGYQITSDAGAFNRAGWTPIAGRLDDSGNGTVDVDDDWVVLTAANSVSDFSEASLGVGALVNGASISLGNGLWAKYHQENSDVKFLYADGVGDNPLEGIVEFVGNGGSAYVRGDVNFDGRLDSMDWSTLASLSGSNFAGKSTAQRYRSGDLNADGAFTIDDVLQFRLDFDAANGVGAFAAMVAGVPEPTGLGLLAIGATIFLGVGRKRPLRSRVRGAAAAASVAMCMLAMNPAQATVYLQQDFNGVALGPKVDETLAGTNVWSKTPPVGWSIDDTGMPATGGVTEWRGWSFASPSWWAAAAEDQGRSQFTKGTGAIAVADPDEWDDIAHAAGTYNSFLKTPSISLAGAGAGAARLRFDSSWMPEGVQTATITVAYNGGAPSEVLRWESEGGNQAFYKQANTNETVVVPLNNPAGATSMQLSFGMTNAGNNWWWAVDNLAVFTPLTLQVDAQSGAMKILGDSSVALTAYEISSPSGSLNPTGWKNGNLDAQNVGTPVPSSADFNGAGGVNAADLAIWKTAFGASAGGDANGDGKTDGADFLRWQRQFGQTSDPASTWLTLLANDSKLIESYLLGSSTFASDRAIGSGYDAVQGARDLQFVYTTLAGEKATGFVQYVNLSPVTAVPEPCGAALMAVGGVACLLRRRHRKTL
ncbi:LamG-like jellyroll fold domain-containing protein [Lacipirellula parvula]|uniref:LamG-like jellyroll fold domain-containing protein n=1 Tax=Lacipirellula parvula TaxID=2650471 RepID=A0A5K7XAH4_9BACT|nr:LamG-like jellyroll fold domain-containing protein [Lacipirellula parvula]BBO32942.1 hypothetical protein PLANPX_2554 [Lacipirellula parvula]